MLLNCGCQVAMDSFKNLLVCFGGPEGLSASVEDCKELKISSTRTPTLFDAYLNAIPHGGSRSIRTEESIWIALSSLRPHINRGNSKPKLDFN